MLTHHSSLSKKKKKQPLADRRQLPFDMKGPPPRPGRPVSSPSTRHHAMAGLMKTALRHGPRADAVLPPRPTRVGSPATGAADGEWKIMTLAGCADRPFTRHMSYYEADAFARWPAAICRPKWNVSLRPRRPLTTPSASSGMDRSATPPTPATRHRGCLCE